MKKLTMIAAAAFLLSLTANAQLRTLAGDTICTNCSVNQIAEKKGYKFTGIYATTIGSAFGVVIYEQLSGKPLFVDAATKAKVPLLLNKFKAEKYKGSNYFFEDIRTMVEEGKLTDLYLIEKVGKPEKVSELVENGRNISVYQYAKLGLTVYFYNSVAVRYIREQV